MLKQFELHLQMGFTTPLAEMDKGRETYLPLPKDRA